MTTKSAKSVRDELANKMWLALNICQRKPHATTIFKEGFDAGYNHALLAEREKGRKLVEALTLLTNQSEPFAKDWASYRLSRELIAEYEQ